MRGGKLLGEFLAHHTYKDIALIEDNPVCRSTIEIAIKSLGYECFASAHHADLLGIVASFNFRVVVVTLDTMEQNFLDLWFKALKDSLSKQDFLPFIIGLSTKAEPRNMDWPLALSVNIIRPLGLFKFRTILAATIDDLNFGLGGAAK